MNRRTFLSFLPLSVPAIAALSSTPAAPATPVSALRVRVDGRLFAAQYRYDATFNAALGGDVDALQRLPYAADELLSASRAAYLALVGACDLSTPAGRDLFATFLPNAPDIPIDIQGLRASSLA